MFDLFEELYTREMPQWIWTECGKALNREWITILRKDPKWGGKGGAGRFVETGHRPGEGLRPVVV